VEKVSHFMRVDAVVSVLVSTHGEAAARSRALREQQNARRARSRRRYEFWGAVASEIDAKRTLE
jgi:hypothetical protein